MADARSSGGLGVVFTAGAVGGLAELLWIAIASAILGVDSGAVARGITATVAPPVSASGLAPVIGLLIHFLLSVALATAFLSTIGRHLRGAALFAAALALLATVWAFNFLVLLPLINPEFVSLLPYPVTLISKLLFGAAMAWVLVAKTPAR